MDRKMINSSRILIVDDEESLRVTFDLFLSREGFGPIRTAATFHEAILAIEEDTFDLIISDIVLEGASGTDFLREVRENGVDCPVVMITGFPNLDTAAEAVRLGAFDYLAKPVNKDTLLKFTRQALKHYALQKEKMLLEIENERYRQYLETVFRCVGDAIITIDCNFQIVEMNNNARQWFKDSAVDIEADVPLNSLPQEIGKCCYRDAQMVIQTRQEVRDHRIECRKKSGQLRIISLNAAPLEDGKGKFLGVVLVARDITKEEVEQYDTVRKRFHRYIGKSPAMQTAYKLMENVGKVDTTVLINGESGTGKELAAEAIHAESPRAKRPLVKVDCTAIPEDLLESELFGHKKGSFTGADRDRMGRILQADGGTLFLDEIGDISPKMQVRLLRFLQEKTFYPVGQDQPIHVDVRVITATNAELKERVADGLFREDLYFRLRVMDIILPPLRERYEDLPLLVEHFLTRFRERLSKEISGLSDQAVQVFYNYHWPGNVRELEHVLERACILCEGTTITLDNLPVECKTKVKFNKGIAGQPGGSSFYSSSGWRDGGELSEAEKISNALQKTGGNKAKAARILGIDRSTVYRKIREFNIDVDALGV
jgi:two-component system, NtrC family, response regulator HydG